MTSEDTLTAAVGAILRLLAVPVKKAVEVLLAGYGGLMEEVLVRFTDTTLETKPAEIEGKLLGAEAVGAITVVELATG